MWETRRILRARSGGVRGRSKAKDRLWIEKDVRSLGVGAQNAVLR